MFTLVFEPWGKLVYQGPLRQILSAGNKWIAIWIARNCNVCSHFVPAQEIADLAVTGMHLPLDWVCDQPALSGGSVSFANNTSLACLRWPRLGILVLGMHAKALLNCNS